MCKRSDKEFLHIVSLCPKVSKKRKNTTIIYVTK